MKFLYQFDGNNTEGFCPLHVPREYEPSVTEFDCIEGDYGCDGDLDARPSQCPLLKLNEPEFATYFIKIDQKRPMIKTSICSFRMGLNECLINRNLCEGDLYDRPEHCPIYKVKDD